jgi:Lanthionine synthetase C-like protein
MQRYGSAKSDWPTWCHGTPGLTLLWAKAYEVSGDEKYLNIARACGLDILKKPQGFSHICCGLAGQAYALLALSRIDGAKRWKSRAQRIALEAERLDAGEIWDKALWKGRSGLLCVATDVLNNHSGFPCIEGQPSYRYRGLRSSSLLHRNFGSRGTMRTSSLMTLPFSSVGQKPKAPEKPKPDSGYRPLAFAERPGDWLLY